MHAHDDRDQFTPPKAPGRTRAVVLAVLAHVLLIVALTWGVAWKSGSDQPAVVAELWSAVPQQAASRGAEPPTPVKREPQPEPPEPAPTPPVPPPPVVEPRPAPKPPPPKAQPDTREADIAIEQEKKRKLKEQEAKEKAEQEKQRKDQQKAEQEKKEKQAKLQKEKAEREKAEQVARDKAERDKEQKKLAEDKRKKDEAIAKADAKAAEDRRKKELARLQGMAGATGAADATGTAQRDSGPSGGYGGKVAAKVKPNIVYPDSISGNPRAEVEVRTSPDGSIVGTRLIKPSGNPAWDDAVLRALEKTATLPRDIDGRVPPSLVIGFRPQD